MSSRFVAIFSAALLFLVSGTAAAERSVVLVTNKGCPVSNLTNLELRKAYLGVSVSVDEHIIRPLRLTTDPELNQIFFQTIVAMTERSYRRRALSMTLKFGTPRPQEYSSLEKALDDLQKSVCSVIFLWAVDVTANEQRVLRVLWQGE